MLNNIIFCLVSFLIISTLTIFAHLLYFYSEVEMEEQAKDYIKPDENNLSFLLWRIMRLWQRERQKFLDEYQTTVSQLELLGGIYYLNKHLGTVTQITLSQETGIDPMTTSTILRNLEKRGFVRRMPSKTDTRARVVETTSEGNALLFKAIEQMRDTEKELLTDINHEIIKDELKKLLAKLEGQKNI